MSRDKTPTLHIYAQDIFHAPAYVIGNREGLEQLRDAINIALVDGVASKVAFASDGEGYEIYVGKTSTNKQWSNVQMPYTDHEFCGKPYGASPSAILHRLRPWFTLRG